ncbi:hypothetical protein [Kitasatospora sp. LaBMicrA B282]|uniref:hypothetical protein n=1 Tax=Kitasatospora sp. LaBMicrA B282 TaxID=3420949 RepID=UPI003D0D2DB7
MRIHSVKSKNPARSVRSSVIALICATAVLGSAATAAPAAFADDSGSQAQQAAATVEKVTGTADLAPSTVLPGGALQAVTNGDNGTATVTAPAAGGALGVSASGTTIGIGLPNTNQAKGVPTDNGTIVYPGAARSADLAVQPTTDGGVRSLITIHDADAAHEYRFDLGLPDGASTQQLDDGSVLVLDQDGQALGMFDAPWAKDANGAPVATSYRVEGGALIQTIAFDQNTAFPVVADPWWNTAWKYTKCVAAVAAAFIPASKAYKAIKGLGGVADAARLLVKAGSAAEFKQAAGNAALNILGISAIQSNCF